MPGALVRAIAPAALSFIMDGEGSDAMASVKTSKVNPKYKRKYRVRNWAAYERGLRDRGVIRAVVGTVRSGGGPCNSTPQ